jgi:hypothetical protein
MVGAWPGGLALSPIVWQTGVSGLLTICAPLLADDSGNLVEVLQTRIQCSPELFTPPLRYAEISFQELRRSAEL